MTMASGEFKTTRERVFERYHSVTRRPDLDDPNLRKMLFTSFERRFSSLLPGDRQAAILEVGCGEGRFLAYLKARGFTHLAGLDISPENVALCHRAGLPFVAVGDLMDLPTTAVTDRYETIFAMDVIEHVPKDNAADVIVALRNRLKPGGALIVQMPNMAHLLGAYYRYHDLTHEFGVNEKSVVDLFMAAGFANERIAVLPAWEAATLGGRMREAYVSLLHRIVFLMDGAARPRIPTKNLIVRALA